MNQSDDEVKNILVAALTAPRLRRDADGLHKRRGIWYYCLTISGERRFFSTKTRSSRRRVKSARRRAKRNWKTNCRQIARDGRSKSCSLRS